MKLWLSLLLFLGGSRDVGLSDCAHLESGAVLQKLRQGRSELSRAEKG